MQLIKQALLMLILGVVADDALCKCKCVDESLVEVVAVTKSKVLSSERIKAPSGFFDVNNQYGCALLAFEIDKNGRAKKIRLVNFYPKRAIAANAKAALERYRFVPGSSTTNAALMFEVNADDDATK